MSDRHLVVLDCETTGLDPNIHVPIEIAAINVDTEEVLSFVPYLSPDKLAQADPDALRINRYFERGVYKQALTHQATVDMYRNLWDFLRGNTLAGANPRFDAAMLMAAAGNGLAEPWHYRLADVSAYVAGALGRYPASLGGLRDCCERLGVTNDVEHSALSDAKATVKCFRIAQSITALKPKPKRAVA